MLILVDYDNIDKATLRRGIIYVVSKIVSRIDPSEVTVGRHLTIRLYGGWYEQNNFTTKAQNLSTDISAAFPNVFQLSDNSTRVIVNCEMAYSLLADPTNHLFHTFRPRGIPEGLKARSPRIKGCTISNCPTVIAYEFIANDVCSSCNFIKPSDIFFRSEQKLIDTMLTSDLIFLSNHPATLCIVSSDDDFWPGIKTTLANGKKIVHLHTRNRLTPSFYTRTTTRDYTQKQL